MNKAQSTMFSKLSADIEQSIRDKNRHVSKINRQPGKHFFFWQAVISCFLPDGDGHDTPNKLPCIAHILGYFAIMLVAGYYGTYHLCEYMMPIFDRLGITVLKHPVVHQIAGVILIFMLVICPLIMAYFMLFRARDYFVKKLEVALSVKGHTEFDYCLHRLAVIVNKSVFEKLLFQALKHKELESYQLLLEFNRDYLFIDFDNLSVREKKRQYFQVEICYDNMLFFIDETNPKWLEHLNKSSANTNTNHNHNRYFYDLLKLCLRENSVCKIVANDEKKALDYQLTMAFFQYFMTSHNLDTHPLVEQMFSECDQMKNYLPLLKCYRLKNKLESELLEPLCDMNMEDEMQVENIKAIKI